MEGCTSNDFYTTITGSQYTRYDCPGNIIIFGALGHENGGVVSLTYENMKSYTLSEDEMLEIESVLDSVTVSN